MLTSISQAEAQETIRARNNMGQTAFLWIKSERQPESAWRRYELNPGPGISVPLIGPDSFELVTEDSDGIEWRDPRAIPIRQLITQRKLNEIVLDGKRAAEMKTSTHWNSRLGRWEERAVTVTKRVAVVYFYNFGDGTSRQREVAASGRRPASAPRPPILRCPPPVYWQGPGCECAPWGS